MKKYTDYIISSLLCLSLILIICFIKGFFPFGNNLLIWSDLFNQVTPLYYYLHSLVYDNASFLINFNIGGGVEMIGNIAYYLISPLSFIVLLFPKSMIINAINVIVFSKIILANITFMFLLKRLFNNLTKINLITLSLIYAFSSYVLTLYIIPGWIDMVYLLPLLFLGIKNLICDKKIGLYITTLTISMITNIYLSSIMLLFIIIFTFVYFIFYDKKDIKETILLLGFSTVISILISSFVIIPTFMQISTSARMGFTFNGLMTSGFGPLTDKVMFFTSSFIGIGSFLIMLLNYKNDKKNVTFIFIILSLLLIPVLIEPINKLLHLGSYVCFAYRYGFISTFIFTLIGGYYLNKSKYDDKKTYTNALFVIFLFIVMGLFTKFFYNDIQNSINVLTFTRNYKIVLIIGVITFLFIVCSIVLLYKRNKLNDLLLLSLVVIFILFNGVYYFGIDSTQNEFKNVLNVTSRLKDNIKDDYRLKYDYNVFYNNLGLFTNINTYDYFTSLTNQDTLRSMQKLGYDSFWMSTSSRGSNIFIDNLFMYKYYLDKSNLNMDLFKEKVQLDKVYSLYEYSLNINEGHLFNNNISFDEESSSFSNTNVISNELFNKDIISIHDNFILKNIEYKNGKLTIVDKNKEASLNMNIKFVNKSNLYFEMIKSFDNKSNQELNKSLDVYINDQFMFNYSNDSYLNSALIGTYENQDVNVKLVLKKEVNIKYIQLGSIELGIVHDIFTNYQNDVSVNFDSNRILINYNSNKEGVLFIPYNLLNGMSAYNHNKEIKLEKMFDNFIGIPVVKGNNDVVICYNSPYLNLGIIISLVGLVVLFIFVKLSNNLLDNKLLKRIMFYCYTLLALIIIGLYLVGLFMFILSFI